MVRIKSAWVGVVLLGLAVFLPGTAASQGAQATPEEVVENVRRAAAYLSEVGPAGLDDFRGAESAYVFKDTYVVVDDCEEERVLMHPFQLQVDGLSFADLPAIGDMTAEEVTELAQSLCAAGRRPGGGWVEFTFPRPGESGTWRKLSYALAVEGTPYGVHGGIYSPDAELADLEALVGP